MGDERRGFTIDLLPVPRVVSRAEAAAVSLVSFPAAAIVFAYGADAIGLAIHPISILLISLTAAVAIGASLAPARRSVIESRTDEDAIGPITVMTIIIALSAWLAWLAWPHLLPIGQGPDLTHHLLLIDYIDRNRHLVHDRTLGPLLGEMTDYPSGLHLLSVLAGSWAHRDGLHAVYAVVALSVALKFGLLSLIAFRCLSDTRDRAAFAVAAVLLLFVPRMYALGSFTHDSYLAQVVSELFAVAMWWAIVCWDQQPSLRLALVLAVFGTATFLTWPVWIGPMLLTLAFVVWRRRDQPARERALHLAVAAIPTSVVAAAYVVRRIGAASAMAATAGAVLLPSQANLGWLFAGVGIAGAMLAATGRNARTIPVLLGAIAAQAGALAYVARHSAAPYLALKMVYLSIYPLAVGGAVALAAAFRSAEASRSSQPALGRTLRFAWVVPTGLLILVGYSLRASPRSVPVVSDDLYAAGRWARDHVPPACVDYLVADDDSGYWLHLAVLGNPRAAARSLKSETFEPQKALERWVLPGGLPYAIAERFDALPKDIRENVDILARFGSAAVVRRRGPTGCAPDSSRRPS